MTTSAQLSALKLVQAAMGAMKGLNLADPAQRERVQVLVDITTLAKAAIEMQPTSPQQVVMTISREDWSLLREQYPAG